MLDVGVETGETCVPTAQFGTHDMRNTSIQSMLTTERHGGVKSFLRPQRSAEGTPCTPN